MSDVLRLLRERDAETQVQFWREHRPTIVAIACDILGNLPDADELADEILVDFLFGAVHRITHEEAIRTYLRLMTIRRSLRRSKKRKNSQEIGELEPITAVAEDDIGMRLLLPRLEKCLQSLTPKARRALRLKYRRELTLENIGRLIGTSKQYAGRLLTKSLEALRTCVEEKGAEHDRGPSSNRAPQGL